MSSSMQHFTHGEQRLRDFIDRDARQANSDTVAYTDEEAAHRNRQLVSGLIIALIALAVIAGLLLL